MMMYVKTFVKYLSFHMMPRLRKYAIQIETTNICNARCPFCPNSTLRREKIVMSDEIFDLIIKKLREEKIPVERFILHLNGEPLTDNKLIERIKKLKQIFPTAEVRFTTNFSLATEELCRQLIESGLDEITISLNSVDPAEYKEIMGLDYQKTLNNINVLAKEKSDLKINFSIVANENNGEAVKEFEKTWRKVGNIRIMQLGRWVGEELPANYNGESKGSQRCCNILYSTINFLSNGDFALCCFDAEGCTNYNIKDTAILKAFRGGKIDMIRRQQLVKGRINEECINCSFR